MNTVTLIHDDNCPTNIAVLFDESMDALTDGDEPELEQLVQSLLAGTLTAAQKQELARELVDNCQCGAEMKI